MTAQSQRYHHNMFVGGCVTWGLFLLKLVSTFRLVRFIKGDTSRSDRIKLLNSYDQVIHSAMLPTRMFCWVTLAVRPRRSHQPGRMPSLRRSLATEE